MAVSLSQATCAAMARVLSEVDGRRRAVGSPVGKVASRHLVGQCVEVAFRRSATQFKSADAAWDI
jgi:hypothetical protein